MPIVWSFNPQLVDLFSAMLRWRTLHNAGGAYELVANDLIPALRTIGFGEDG